MSIRAYLYLTLCTLFWSGNFIVGKVATLFEIPPLTLNFYRRFIAFLILCPFTLKGVIMNFEEIKKKREKDENIKRFKKLKKLRSRL